MKNILPNIRDEIKRVKKKWGEEIWLVNRLGYCGKILLINPNKKTSLHYHFYKYETFWVIDGSAEVELISYQDSRKRKKIKLSPGDLLDVDTYILHRITALEKGLIMIEFSKEHLDWDVKREEDS